MTTYESVFNSQEQAQLLTFFIFVISYSYLIRCINPARNLNFRV